MRVLSFHIMQEGGPDIIIIADVEHLVQLGIRGTVPYATDFSGGEDISGFIARCAKIKRTELTADGIYGSFGDDDKVS